jgi:hypothetical protein
MSFSNVLFVLASDAAGDGFEFRELSMKLRSAEPVVGNWPRERRSSSISDPGIEVSPAMLSKWTDPTISPRDDKRGVPGNR